MRYALRGLTLCLCALTLCAQTPPAASARAGLVTDWDIASVLFQIGNHADRLLPALQKLDARSWITKGAPDTYQQQLESCRVQAKALGDGARSLAHNPEKLSASLEVMFRIQGLDTMLNSLEEAMRKYQSSADAQALASLAAEIGANRDRFQQYIVNLAAEREQDLEVMDREAQRCRGMVQQAPPVKTGRKR